MVTALGDHIIETGEPDITAFMFKENIKPKTFTGNPEKHKQANYHETQQTALIAHIPGGSEEIKLKLLHNIHILKLVDSVMSALLMRGLSTPELHTGHLRCTASHFFPSTDYFAGAVKNGCA